MDPKSRPRDFPFLWRTAELLREPEMIQKGKWYFENIELITGARFDHFDPVVGATLKGPRMKDAQTTLYAKLRTPLQSL